MSVDLLKKLADLRTGEKTFEDFIEEFRSLNDFNKVVVKSWLRAFDFEAQADHECLKVHSDKVIPKIDDEQLPEEVVDDPLYR